MCAAVGKLAIVVGAGVDGVTAARSVTSTK
jgi:hypothetical protein